MDWQRDNDDNDHHLDAAAAAAVFPEALRCGKTVSRGFRPLESKTPTGLCMFEDGRDLPEALDIYIYIEERKEEQSSSFRFGLS